MTVAVKVTAIASLICLFAIAAYPSLAQTATSPGTTRKGAVKERVETRKEKVETKITNIREKAASREAVLREKLAAFKDKRKATVTEKVSTNLNRINENHTKMMLKFLSRASEILSKLEARVNQGTADIKDAAAAKTAIVDARASIATATDAVNAQAAKDYTITVSTETRVKVDAQAQRKHLHDDLAATRELVGDAKKAVATAIEAAKSGTGAKEATPSGQ